MGQPYICHWTKESFDSSIDGYLRVFQNHRKQAKNNVVFHCFPSLGLKEPPWFWKLVTPRGWTLYLIVLPPSSLTRNPVYCPTKIIQSYFFRPRRLIFGWILQQSFNLNVKWFQLIHASFHKLTIHERCYLSAKNQGYLPYFPPQKLCEKYVWNQFRSIIISNWWNFWWHRQSVTEQWRFSCVPCFPNMVPKFAE